MPTPVTEKSKCYKFEQDGQLAVARGKLAKGITKRLGYEKARDRIAHRYKVTPEQVDRDVKLAEDFQVLSTPIQYVISSGELPLTCRDIRELSELPEKEQCKVVHETKERGVPIGVVLRGEEPNTPVRKVQKQGIGSDFSMAKTRVTAAISSFDTLIEQYPWCTSYHVEALKHFSEVLRVLNDWKEREL